MQGDKTAEVCPPQLEDERRSALTPFFVAFLCALLLVAVFAFRAGFTEAALAEFLVLALTVTGSVLFFFSCSMIWGTRMLQRVDRLAHSRPGALVFPALRVTGLRRAVARLRTKVSYLPLGLTVVADSTGVEVWGGSAEHPVRIGRAPWEVVSAIQPTRITRWGREQWGLGIRVRDGQDGGGVDLAVCVLGAGLGGTMSPRAAQIAALAEELCVRRTDARARLSGFSSAAE